VVVTSVSPEHKRRLWQEDHKFEGSLGSQQDPVSKKEQRREGREERRGGEGRERRMKTE
jgi:hypothetical protein